MALELSVGAVLEAYGIPRRGAAASIAKDLKIDRRTVGKLLDGQSTVVSIAHLNGLCDWLTKRGVPADTLPGALFRNVNPWQRAITAREVRFSIGQRDERVLGSGPNPSPRSWVATSDASTHGFLISQLSRRGTAPISTGYVALQASKVAMEGHLASVSAPPEHSAHFIIGSQRSNRLLEHWIAHCFGVEPDVARRDHPIPFYILYRDSEDRVSESCFGGRNPPRTKGGPEPGIYYRTGRSRRGKDTWRLLPWTKDRTNAAIAIVTESAQRAITIALFGYTGFATAAVGRELVRRPWSFWPLERQTANQMPLGIFACGIQWRSQPDLQSEDFECQVTQLEDS